MPDAPNTTTLVPFLKINLKPTCEISKTRYIEPYTHCTSCLITYFNGAYQELLSNQIWYGYKLPPVLTLYVNSKAHNNCYIASSIPILIQGKIQLIQRNVQG